MPYYLLPLSCYMMLCAFTDQTFNLPMFYLHRFLRLTPALAMVVFLQATLYNHTGSGPLWHLFNDGLVTSCQTHWWTTLLYVQNYAYSTIVCKLDHYWWWLPALYKSLYSVCQISVFGTVVVFERRHSTVRAIANSHIPIDEKGKIWNCKRRIVAVDCSNNAIRYLLLKRVDGGFYPIDVSTCHMYLK